MINMMQIASKLNSLNWKINEFIKWIKNNNYFQFEIYCLTSNSPDSVLIKGWYTIGLNITLGQSKLSGMNKVNLNTPPSYMP